jgi:hypothetical protein
LFSLGFVFFQVIARQTEKPERRSILGIVSTNIYFSARKPCSQIPVLCFMWRTLVSKAPNLLQGAVFIVIEYEKAVCMELIMPGAWMGKHEKKKTYGYCRSGSVLHGDETCNDFSLTRKCGFQPQVGMKYSHAE